MQTKSWHIPVLLFLLSFSLRFFFISKGPYHLDCLALAINAQTLLEKHYLPYQFGLGYPLTVLSAAFFVGLAKLFSIQDPVWGVNFMSVFYSSLTVPVFYFFVQKLFDKTAALCAALLLSLNPIFLALSVYGNSHTASIFLLILSFYFLVGGSEKRWFLFALTFGLFGASRLQDMVLMIPVVFIFFLGQNRDNFPANVRTSTNLILGSLLIALIFHAPYFLGPSSKNYIRQLQEFYGQGVTSSFAGLFSQHLLSSIKFIALVTGAVFGVFIALFCLLKEKKFVLAAFLLCWIVTPLLFYGNLQTSAPRFFLISIIPVIILESYALFHFLKIKNRFYKITLVVLTFALAFAPLPVNTFQILAFRRSVALLPDWAKLIEKRTEPDAFLISGDDAFAISHYARREILARPLNLTAASQHELNRFQNSLDTALAAQTPVYITLTGLISYDEKLVFLNFLKNNYRLEFRGRSISEDWHNGELVLDIIDEALWQVLPKPH